MMYLRLTALAYHSLEVVIEQFAYSCTGLLSKGDSRVWKPSNAVTFITCLEGEFQLLDALV